MSARRRRSSRGLIANALIAAVAASVLYVLWLPDVAPLKKSNPQTTAYIELRRAQAERAGKRFSPRMTWLPWGRISEHLKHAVFIAEDDTFYQHGGVDWESVKSAVQKDWEMKRFAYGGSTITQQVARNLYLSPSKNPLRKIKELFIAWRLEKALGKRRIFELYLNIAEWGKGIYGAEAAAQAYFGKSAADLSADEAVAMAVVLPNPNRWNPAKRGNYVERNMRRVVGRMQASGFLPDDAVGAPGEELRISSATFDSAAAAISTGAVSEP
ncbi:MAG: monofunctional biosynthetic peptidoglycan transglycosylase [Elusimicrobiota bacterium]|jgi:monofunctional biosynthetic peptidoglycan transglycosylase